MFVIRAYLPFLFAGSHFSWTSFSHCTQSFNIFSLWRHLYVSKFRGMPVGVWSDKRKHIPRDLQMYNIHFLRQFWILTVLNNRIHPWWRHSPTTFTIIHSIVYKRVVGSEVSSTLLKISNVPIKSLPVGCSLLLYTGLCMDPNLSYVPTRICAIMSSNVSFCATVNTYQ